MQLSKWKIGVIKVTKHIWYRYIKPKRLTLDCNPTVYRWTFFYIANEEKVNTYNKKVI